MTSELLSLDKAVVAYNGDITVLNELSLIARPGKVTGIIGPNGAGKSTALKTLAGLLPLKSGAIKLGDQDLSRAKAHERALNGIAFVPQNRSTFGDLSVADNLQLGCWPFRRDKARIARVLDEVYARFPALHQFRNSLARELSGGQQRFLEIARALLLEPRVILLDEPTAMIAPKLSKEIYALTEDLAREGATIVLVDQNVRQCAAISDHLYILEMGRNKADGDRSNFESDGQLREMVAEWVDYKIDV
ncbi:ABC transporter ATP-binding protein [uncultured Cohaesibacter sp.]|uniref:ABC transporter ATP-binding protein n=1 Tax=uncultured Cohaesibacter sp. TaxID=1002546 RepID=UPI0029C67113|nr:ABC transporter ATP-binding protein [uncultured Cohaesibacter sp.]